MLLVNKLIGWWPEFDKLFEIIKEQTKHGRRKGALS